MFRGIGINIFVSSKLTCFQWYCDMVSLNHEGTWVAKVCCKLVPCLRYVGTVSNHQKSSLNLLPITTSMIRYLNDCLSRFIRFKLIYIITNACPLQRQNNSTFLSTHMFLCTSSGSHMTCNQSSIRHFLEPYYQSRCLDVRKIQDDLKQQLIYLTKASLKWEILIHLYCIKDLLH